ncbi:MAG: hypothetical protein QM674_13715 [Burkholderiaceae bacterium]
MTAVIGAKFAGASEGFGLIGFAGSAGVTSSHDNISDPASIQRVNCLSRRENPLLSTSRILRRLYSDRNDYETAT